MAFNGLLGALLFRVLSFSNCQVTARETIIGRGLAKAVEFPSIVSLSSSGYDGQHSRGDTFVEARIVITAAHSIGAFSSGPTFSVRAGSLVSCQFS